MEIRIDFDTRKVEQKILSRLVKTQMVLDQEVAKDSNYFAPEDQGYLKDSVYLRLTPGTLVWDIMYARVLYYGLEYNFSKDKNPNARAKWFEWAKTANLKKWVRIANNEYHS